MPIAAQLVGEAMTVRYERFRCPICREPMNRALIYAHLIRVHRWVAEGTNTWPTTKS